VRTAAARRLVEELGVADVPFTEVGVYTYYAGDPATGRVEYEYDHVLLGDLPAGVPLAPDPDEVADCKWVTVPALLADLGRDARAYAPWLPGVTTRLAEHLDVRPLDHPPRPNAGPAGRPRGPIDDRGPTDDREGGVVAEDEAPERSGGR
jgi:isopentenyl-diphosphate delta-isomerase